MSSWYRRMFAIVLLFAGAAAPWSAVRAVDESDLLPVDQAFALTATAPTRDRIELHWRIADGYYLYRQRIHVQAGNGFGGGSLQLPTGTKHHDEFFGDVETYRKDLVAALPGHADGDRVSLEVKYQGCADLGVCYPPQRRTLTVALPSAAAAADTGLALGPPASTPLLGGPLGGMDANAQPLPPEQAFAFEAIVGDGNTVLMRFTPAKGYYLYRDRSAFKVTGADGVAAGAPRWPQGTLHRDEHFGNVVVYFDQVDVPLPLVRKTTDAANITLTTTFQGCQTDGICYPPMTRAVALQLPAVSGLTPVSPAGATPVATGSQENIATPVATHAAPAGNAISSNLAVAAEAAPATAPAQSDDSRLAAALAGSHKLWALLLFFGAGVLLSLTPCVYPMIPILAGLIAGHGTRLGTTRALLLASVFVLANALVFTAAGVVAGLLGANLQAAFQNPWIIVAFALLFVALALPSFGMYELQLPMALRAKLGAVSDRQHGGSLVGVAMMGALSALIVGPCVAPPLAGAVLYIGQSHDPVLGGAALFVLALGMGVPLLVFGAAAGRGMPTSGAWMTAVQRVFGFVFLGLAVWMLSRILPGPATLALWGLLALAAATWVLTTATQAPRTRLAARFAGLVFAVVGVGQLLGALAGGSDPLQPLAGVVGASPSRELAFRTIKSSADLDRELAAAQAAGKPLLFDFYADWCVSCREMEKYTFTDPAVQSALADFVLLKADVTANDATDQALMQRFGIIGPPATLFFGRGSEQRGLRLVGYEKVPLFLDRLQRARQ